MLIIIPYYGRVPQNDRFTVGDLKTGHVSARTIATGFKTREEAVEYIKNRELRP